MQHIFPASLQTHTYAFFTHLCISNVMQKCYSEFSGCLSKGKGCTETQSTSAHWPLCGSRSRRLTNATSAFHSKMHWATFHAGPHTQPAQSRQSCSTGNPTRAPAAVTSRFAKRLKLSEIFHCILKILCVLHILAPTSFSLLADRADMLSPYGRFLSRLSL